MSVNNNTIAQSYVAEVRIIKVNKIITTQFDKLPTETRTKRTLATVVVGDSDLVQLLNKVHGHLELINDSGDIDE